MRFFNTAGPVDSSRHYCLDPLGRFDLQEIERLVDQQKYFVLHAPRQTGKTSTMLALTQYLNKQGDYRIFTLYAQHTDGTVQKFTDDALEAGWHFAAGQPRLVNALPMSAVSR